MKSLLLSLVIVVLGACGSTSDVDIGGELNDSGLQLSRAYYGVILGLGSHEDQQNPDVPANYLVDLIIASERVECSMLSWSLWQDEDFHGIRLHFLELAVGEQDTRGVGRRLTEADAKAFAVGTLEISDASLTGLPDRSGSPPFEGVAGEIKGTVAMNFISCGEFFVPDGPAICGTEDAPATGQIEGQFVAQHCSELDSILGE